MEPDARIQELQVGRAYITETWYRRHRRGAWRWATGNFDVDGPTLQVSLDAEAVTFDERMVRVMRNLMVFNAFVEYIQKGLAVVVTQERLTSDTQH